MKNLLMILVAVTASWTHPATAQQKPRLAVVVDLNLPNETGSACGVMDGASIKSIASLTLRNNGVRPDDNLNPFLYVQVQVIPAIRGNRVEMCFWSIEVQVLEFVIPSVKPVGGFKPRTGKTRTTTELCRTAHAAIESPSNSERSLMSSLEQHIKVCLGQLDY